MVCDGNEEDYEIIESGMQACNECKGIGLVYESNGVASGYYHYPNKTCPKCYGYGGFYYDVKKISKCYWCKEGKIEKEKLVEAKPDKPAHRQTILIDCGKCNGTGESVYTSPVPDKDSKNTKEKERSLRQYNGVCMECGEHINFMARKFFGADRCEKCREYANIGRI